MLTSDHWGCQRCNSNEARKWLYTEACPLSTDTGFPYVSGTEIATSSLCDSLLILLASFKCTLMGRKKSGNNEKVMFIDTDFFARVHNF